MRTNTSYFPRIKIRLFKFLYPFEIIILYISNKRNCIYKTNGGCQVIGTVHKSELEMFAGSGRNLESDRKLRISLARFLAPSFLSSAIPVFN